MTPKSDPTFNQLVFSSNKKLAMPIAAYPGLPLTGARVCDLVTNPRAQVEVQSVLKERYKNRVVLSAMDLSAEAEAFGCALHLSDNEVPSIAGRLITSMEAAQALSNPKPGDKRTAVHLEGRPAYAIPARPSDGSRRLHWTVLARRPIGGGQRSHGIDHERTGSNAYSA